MKFVITQDKAHNWNTWTLVTNADAVIASSSAVYNSVAEAQQAIAAFKTWVTEAGIEIVTREPVKDWRQQAMEQIKKTPWKKG